MIPYLCVWVPLLGWGGMLRGMRHARGVGAAAAGMAVAVLVVGCGGGGDGKPAAAPPSPVESTGPDELASAPVEPEYPPTPEGEFDKAADANGWAAGDTYGGSAAAFVHDICESLPVSAADSSSRPQWLVESGQMDGDGARSCRQVYRSSARSGPAW